MESKDGGCGVAVNFTFNGASVHTFEAFPTETEIRANMPPDAEEQDRYSYRYTGKKDGGPLPKLKEGHHNLLTAALQGAKSDADTYLTSVLQEGKANQRKEVAADDGDEMEEDGQEEEVAENHDSKTKKQKISK